MEARIENEADNKSISLNPSEGNSANGSTDNF